MATPSPQESVELSVIIPIHNEEAILEVALRALLPRVAQLGRTFEIVLAENGSRDTTRELARILAAELGTAQGTIRVLHTPQPNYGRALRRGIEEARGRYVVCDEIDLGDVDFYARALALLERGADLVVGSKRHPNSVDARPWIRRKGTQVINGLLRVSLGFRGTDTHGLKAFRRAPLLPVVRACRVEHDLFASELVIRAMRGKLEVHEIPLRLREIRPPSVGLARRVPRVLGNLARLVYVIRVRGSSS